LTNSWLLAILVGDLVCGLGASSGHCRKGFKRKMSSEGHHHHRLLTDPREVMHQSSLHLWVRESMSLAGPHSCCCCGGHHSGWKEQLSDNQYMVCSAEGQVGEGAAAQLQASLGGVISLVTWLTDHMSATSLCGSAM
jgi:hypothetical protein